MIKFANEKKTLEAISEAFKTGNETKIQEAWKGFHESVVEQVKADFEELKDCNDSAVLAQRGYRQLTAQETKYYEKFIAAGKSSNPKQAFTTLLGSELEEDLMPTTIIQDVYKDLAEDYPLLNAINFVHVGYLTKWILNDHSTQLAKWGKITDEITKEITSAFDTIDVNQSKLTAFAVIELGMLDLGPTFLDGYIRTVLKEALKGGLVQGIVLGNGLDQPIGLVRDISEGVSVSSTEGYPLKSLTALTSITPKTYGELVAQLAKTEKGKKRIVQSVGLICNQTDYLTKIMPATTVMNTSGSYVNNIFPVKTNVYICNELEDGKAVLFLEKGYFMGMGGSKNGVIEYTDEYRFLEDQRVFKIKQYGTGRAYDNTCALYLDISNLEEAYIKVKNIETTVTA